MRDYVHEHFAKHAPDTGKAFCVRPAIVCADGTIYSVQASEGHYCNPKETGAARYASVEVWGPRRRDPEGWVSVRRVNRRIHRHGGTA